MLMKILIFLWLLMPFLSHSQIKSMYGDKMNFDVKMKYVHTYEEAIAKAQKEKKLIFFNCFADWAVPCHAMNRVVFTDQKFADWADKNFVCLFVDVTKQGKGRELTKKYQIKAQPHYLILDSNGEIVQRIIGGDASAEKFKKKLEFSLNKKNNMSQLKERYEKGNRDKTTLRNYATSLVIAGEHDLYPNVIKELFAKIGEKEKFRKEYWILYKKLAYPHTEKLFSQLLLNKEEAIKHNGKEPVEEFIGDVFLSGLYSYVTSEVGVISELQDIYYMIESAKLDKNDLSYVFYKLAVMRARRDINGIIELIKENNTKLNKSLSFEVTRGLLNFDNLNDKEKLIIEEYLLNDASKSFDGAFASSYSKLVEEMHNTDGIKFIDTKIDQAKQMSREQGKPIFIDCYTSWCGPCQKLARNVFPLKEVGDFFNPNFINMKINMEENDGKEIAQKYGIKVFPTMIIIDSEGKVVHRFEGFLTPNNLIVEVKKGLEKFTQNKY